MDALETESSYSAKHILFLFLLAFGLLLLFTILYLNAGPEPGRFCIWTVAALGRNLPVRQQLPGVPQSAHSTLHGRDLGCMAKLAACMGAQ